MNDYWDYIIRVGRVLCEGGMEKGVMTGWWKWWCREEGSRHRQGVMVELVAPLLSPLFPHSIMMMMMMMMPFLSTYVLQDREITEISG